MNAKPFSRFIAGVINCLLFILFYPIVIFWISLSQTPEEVLFRIVISVSLGIFHTFVFYFVESLLVSNLGANIGKLVTGLTVVNEKREKLSFSDALFLTFIGNYVLNATFGLGSLLILQKPKHLGLNDLVSGTEVLVKSPKSIFLGILVSILLALLICFFVGSSFSNFINYKSLYENIFIQIFNSTPAPTSLEYPII